MQEFKKLSFKFIKETNQVEVTDNGQLLTIEVNESENFLSDLVKLNQIKKVKSNIINRTSKSWWQKNMAM